VHGPEHAPLIVVLGGISANCFPCTRPDGSAGWWQGLAEKGGVLETDDYRILGIDFIADPSGLSAPSPIDQATVVCAALDQIGVARAKAVVGASYGGMIALSLGQYFPHRTESLVVVSADARPHPAATALRELQRRIVALGLANGNPDEALSIARGLAMLGYRTPAEFAARFVGGIPGMEVHCGSEPGAYLRARGDAFAQMMSPQRFLSLSASIDRHQVDPSRIACPTLLIGAETDQLVPPEQMRSLAEHLAGPVDLHVLPSLYGHDMFLKDTGLISDLIAAFLEARS
jgi:homoserine O-acetyltransferase